jgi:hypothetical protein
MSDHKVRNLYLVESHKVINIDSGGGAYSINEMETKNSQRPAHS